MKTLVLFGSTRSSTKRIVESLGNYFSFQYDVVNVIDSPSNNTLQKYDLLLFFSPTYGDEELQEDMENFLVNYKGDLSSKYYAICEVGNYHGYDDFSYGAMPIIRKTLQSLHAEEFIDPVSVDSLPKKDWNILKCWCEVLNTRIALC